MIPLLSQGFGELSLTELDLGGCDALDQAATLQLIIEKFQGLTKLGLAGWKQITDLTEGDFTLINFIFSFLFSKGFGDLSNLETLNLVRCDKLELLPDSKSRHSESFYFLIFDARRLRAAGEPQGA